MSPAPSIVIDDLTKRYGSLTAVSGLTLSAEPGDVLGFIGPNGAGKTTTIRTLLGFLSPTKGRCSILGGWPGRDTALRRRIGYLPSDFRVDPRMTPRELFAWFSKLRGGIESGHIQALADRLHLDTDRRFGTLSKGNRQKVGLVQAFMHDPDVLILDEPTSGLDPILQRELLRLVYEAAQRGASVLFSSHVLPEVEHIATRVAMIRRGLLLKVSTADELMAQARSHLDLRYADPIPDGLFAGVPGVVASEVSGNRASVTVDGPVGPVMRVAAAQPGLLQVRNASDDLERLFVSLYAPETQA